MNKKNTNNTTEDGQQQSQNLKLQHQSRQQNPNLKAARPYRRRIKPPPTKVHHVHAASFRRFVQSRTCSLPGPDIHAAAASTVAAAPVLQPGPADQLAWRNTDGAAHGGDQTGATAACLINSRSMQQAYMTWCSSNDIPLSPGTMAELSFTMHRPSNATSNTPLADNVTGIWDWEGS